MILPNLAERLAWYQDRLRPEDPAMGNGIADCTIEARYVPEIKSGDGFAYGATCSPGDPSRYPTPEDIAAKRFLILVAVPKNETELAEVDTTLWHECNHILDAMVAPLSAMDRDAAENATHSRDNFLKKLTPAESTLFARIISKPTARAYRAEDKAMPDPTQDDNKDKKPDKGAPAMQEGAPRDVATIQGEIAKAALAGQPVDELAKELALALVAAGSAAGNGPPSTPPPPPDAPTMGMTPDQAYARGKRETETAATAKANIEAVKAFADVVEGLSDDQRAMVRKQSSIEDAKALVKTYPTSTQGATFGALPGKTPGKTTEADETPFARMRKGPTDPMVREALGLGNAVPGAHGIGTAPAHILTLSFHEQAQEFQTKNRAKMAKAREAAQ